MDPGYALAWGRRMAEEGIIWIGETPRAKLDRGGVHVIFKSDVRVCTFRMLPENARELAGDIVFLLDEQARKPSNVRPFKRR